MRKIINGHDVHLRLFSYLVNHVNDGTVSEKDLDNG